MLNQKTILTPELGAKLDKLEAVFIAFNPNQLTAIITSLEVLSSIISNEKLANALYPQITGEQREEMNTIVFSTLQKIEETFNEEFQAKQTARILSNFNENF